MPPPHQLRFASGHLSSVQQRQTAKRLRIIRSATIQSRGGANVSWPAIIPTCNGNRAAMVEARLQGGAPVSGSGLMTAALEFARFQSEQHKGPIASLQSAECFLHINTKPVIACGPINDVCDSACHRPRRILFLGPSFGSDQMR